MAWKRQGVRIPSGPHIYRATIFYVTAGELVTLGLYLMQQLGVMLGVGAATVTLIAHLVSTRDGVVEPTEARFARTIERLLMVGLFFIIVSGVAITAIHSLEGEAQLIFTPAYIFKWLLIGVVALPLIAGHKNPFPPILFEGFIGATWYALFILHVIAPITTWVDLALLYVAWTAGFLVLWTGLARLIHANNFTLALAKKSEAPAAPKPVVATPAPKPTPKPVVTITPAPKLPTPPPAPVAPLTPKLVAAVAPTKPVAAAAPHKPAELPPAHVLLSPKSAEPVPAKPALSVPAKPPTKPEEKVEDPDQYPGLPAIRVMPRTPEDVDKQLREAIVQFS